MDMSKTSHIPIIILAAGQSIRMRGTDKLLQHISTVPLIKRQTEIALQATNGTVIVTLPSPPHPRYDALEGLNIQRVPVADAREGMAASLRAGFANLPKNTTAAMLLLADLPELTQVDLKKLLSAVDTGSKSLAWQATTEAGCPGHPIVFSSTLFPKIAELTGDIGARAILKQATNRITFVALPENRARRDLDTPEDWAAWREERSDD